MYPSSSNNPPLLGRLLYVPRAILTLGDSSRRKSLVSDVSQSSSSSVRIEAVCQDRRRMNGESDRPSFARTARKTADNEEEEEDWDMALNT